MSIKRETVGKIFLFGFVGCIIANIVFGFFTAFFGSWEFQFSTTRSVVFFTLFILAIVCFIIGFILSPGKNNQDHEKIISFIDNYKNKQQQLNNRHRRISKNYKKRTANRNINSFEKNSNIKQMDLPEELNGNLPHSDRLKEKFGNWDCSSQEMYLAMNYAYNLGYDTGYDTGYNHGYSAGSASHH
ncbi:MAG: hypothetical protein VZR11_13475 [Succinimonas sp.]|nr:hypothetical protein [Succinimonas sp.]